MKDEFKKYPDLLIAPPDALELVDEFKQVDTEVTRRCMELIAPGVTRGAFYWLLRKRRQSDSMAAMLACQKGPGLNTDDTFFHGQKPLYEQFGSQKHLDRYLQAAKQKGFTPSPNATYFPSLARFQGDPEAFVTRAQGRSYIRKLCEQRGWACDGDVKVEARQPDSDPLDSKNCKALGEDIISAKAQEMAKANPEVKRMDRKKLREKIIHKHGPQKAD